MSYYILDCSSIYLLLLINSRPTRSPTSSLIFDFPAYVSCLPPPYESLASLRIDLKYISYSCSIFFLMYCLNILRIMLSWFDLISALFPSYSWAVEFSISFPGLWFKIFNLPWSDDIKLNLTIYSSFLMSYILSWMAGLLRRLFLIFRIGFTISSAWIISGIEACGANINF